MWCRMREMSRETPLDADSPAARVAAPGLQGELYGGVIGWWPERPLTGGVATAVTDLPGEVRRIFRARP